MIRIVRLQDVVDLEGGGGVSSVMVLSNDSGLSAEVPVTTEQMGIIVRLVQADTEAPAPGPEPERPRLADDQIAHTVLPSREVNVFEAPDPDAPAHTERLDMHSVLDMVQPDSADDIPGEWGGLEQL
jgi:hypothetical protein